jgi:hypothetical protein
LHSGVALTLFTGRGGLPSLISSDACTALCSVVGHLLVFLSFCEQLVYLFLQVVQMGLYRTCCLLPTGEVFEGLQESAHPFDEGQGWFMGDLPEQNRILDSRG